MKPLEGKTVLCVDDFPQWRHVVKFVVSEAGAAADTASSVADAKAWLESHPPPDVILLGGDFGDGRGTDLIPHIQEHAPATARIMLSRDHESILEEVRSTKDFDAVLPKPIGSDDLVSAIATAIEARQAEKLTGLVVQDDASKQQGRPSGTASPTNQPPPDPHYHLPPPGGMTL